MMNKLSKFTYLCVLIFSVFFFMTGQAFGLPILNLFQSGANQASDEDREYLVDRNITIPGQLDVGDAFRGHININTLNSGAANVGGITGNEELSGVFQVMAAAFGSPDPNTGFYPILWVPDPAFEAVYGAGAIAALYSDPTPDFAADFNDPFPAAAPPADTDADMNFPVDDGTVGPRTIPPSSADVSTGAVVTEEAFMDTARTSGVDPDSVHRFTLGFLGLPGEGAAANGLLNVMPAFGLSSGSAVGSSNFGLNLLWMDPAYDIFLDINRVTPSIFGGTVDFALSQQLRGVSDLDTAFEISSNTNISFNATVIPEPASMLLLGAGLLGLAVLGRKKLIKKG